MDYLILVLLVVGVVGGVAARWVPARGKVGVAFALLGLAGYPLAAIFC